MKPHVVRAAERHVQTGQTSGMVREEAARTEKMWAGVARNAPKAFSGWHHHGDHESAIYVLNGQVRIECGPGGRTVLEGGPGDFLFIPAREIHREGNPTDATTDVVLVRAGQGEVVVNVEGPE
ncbi:MAG: cupin domain-containing protein [Chloroflexota bacterium]